MYDWLEFRHFKYLLTILELRGFRAAAEQLNAGQPNLSIQAKQFQEYASLRLYEKAIQLENPTRIRGHSDVPSCCHSGCTAQLVPERTPRVDSKLPGTQRRLLGAVLKRSICHSTIGCDWDELLHPTRGQ